MSSIFDGIEQGPPIEVFALNKAFLEDNSPDKVNLGVGGELNRRPAMSVQIDPARTKKSINYALKSH